ncbi:uncharacterized protein LOC111915229 [Lactuca sativa]|uniref:uncharacterized protein LOC111915229 n=1 Tax=Lactuca sativa TaxID=4236 RepID=UPI000CB75E5E|nr:uncharacterized protein LOC111915229 [Lactuca sativa]
MKIHTKPISSPGTTDDFPPPLMMFPRSKSKRGSRSRANPMFSRKINTTNDPTQEPSSPKVTCIGQVRVSRSNNKQPTTTTAFRSCRWLQKVKSGWFQRLWRTNLSFFRCDCCKKSESLPESKRIEVNQAIEYGKREIEDVIGPDNVILIPESPPRNAFLLTRSSSAPYRSSSLAYKFWESTIEKTRMDTEDDETGEKVNEGEGINGNSEDESFFNGDEEFKAEPLNLSRCKSEPARIGDKFFTSFSS